MSTAQTPGGFGLTMVVVMIPLVVVISLSLMFMTGWPTWVTSVVGGGVGGLTSPFLTRWILARHAGQDRPSSVTGNGSGPPR